MDYYAILGVSKSSSQSDIKKAYHKQSLIWHPDKNNNSEVSKIKFQQISEAYQVLSNKTNKNKYDTFGTSPDKFRSPEDLFSEICSKLKFDPVIKDFISNTFTKFTSELNDNPDKKIWDIFKDLNSDKMIDSSGDLVKHLLKKHNKPQYGSVVNKYVYQLKLSIDDVDIHNEINITLECMRQFTHIRLTLFNSSVTKHYMMPLKFNEHILEFADTRYFFYLCDCFPEGYKRHNNHDLILEYKLHYKYITTGFKLSYPYEKKNPLDLNICFKHNSNLVKILNKGGLKQDTNTYGDLYILFEFIYSDNYTNEKLIECNVPIYNNLDIISLI